MAKFIALNQKLSDYLERHHSERDDDLLRELRERTAQLGDEAEMQIAPEQGTLLQMLVAISGAKRAIEIGTFTGYSALCIARGLGEDGHLTCLDKSEEWTQIAREFWKRAGVENRISLKIGDAAQTLRVLAQGVVAPDEMFDFAFLDADKPGYDLYYETLLPHLKTGALILFDNMMRLGKVAAPLETLSDSPLAVAKLNDKLVNDARVQCVLLPVADGLMLCRKL